MSIVQPLYGGLSDIYGRKPVSFVTYAMFARQSGAGLGRSLGEEIAWRAVQGIGGAGMGSLVAIIIVHIVPMHDVAMTRSDVNSMQTSSWIFLLLGTTFASASCSTIRQNAPLNQSSR
jgi:MFS family permease